MKQHNYYVYIMASQSGTIYTGVTSNLEKRVWQHKQKLIEGFSKKYNCTKLVYVKMYQYIEDAIRREKYIKGKTRRFKEILIASINPGWSDLSERDSSLCSE